MQSCQNREKQDKNAKKLIKVVKNERKIVTTLLKFYKNYAKHFRSAKNLIKVVENEQKSSKFHENWVKVVQNSTTAA